MKSLNKIRLNIIFVFSIFLLNIIFISNIFAEETSTSVPITSTTDTSISTIDLEMQTKKEALTAINKIIEDIKVNINSISKKLSGTKQRTEYNTYPAVRLNIDTPLFGLSSIVNKKLKITKDVSAIDVASGYSIRDIVRKGIVKVPSFSVGSVVVLTRDIKIDDKITLKDANTVLLNLMKYLKQSQIANDFLDNEINKTFSSYIPKQKSEKITDITNRLNSIESSLAQLENKIVSLYIINKDNAEYAKDIESYYAMYEKVTTLKESIKEVLITDENLNNVEKETLLQEAALIDLKTNTEKFYSSAITEYDIVAVLNNLKTNVTAIKDEIKKYIDDSKVVTDVNGEKTTTKVYDVTSTETLEYMNNITSTLDQKIIKYAPKPETSNLPEEVINKAEVINAGSGEVSSDERTALLEELVKLYKEYNLKENDFYLVNINSYQVDATSKISSMIKVTDENIVSTIKYMYLELPSNLEKYSKLNDTNSNNEIKKVTISLKEEIKKACNVDIRISDIYSKIDKNEL